MDKVSTFASRLRELLDKKNLTQAGLAKLSGISKSSINHYLKGDWEGKQDAVYAIADTTNTNEAWLMGYDVPMEKSSNDLLYKAAEDLVLHNEFDALTKEQKEAALNSVRSQAVPEKNKPAELELDELDKELLRLAAQLTPEQKRRQVETLRDIVGKKDT